MLSRPLSPARSGLWIPRMGCSSGRFCGLLLALPEVLASVERDHLSCDRGRLPQITYRGAEFSKVRTPAERERRSFLTEAFHVLVLVGQGRTGADGIDPDSRRKRLGHGDGGCPQCRFRQGVAKEAGRRSPDTLIDHVDDQALRVGRKQPSEASGNQGRGLYVQGEMPVPNLVGEISQRI